MENSLVVYQKKKKKRIELVYNPANSLLGIYPKNLKSCICKDICIPTFIAVLFIGAKTRKQPKCHLIEDWIQKMWHIYTMEYYSPIRKDEILPLMTTWMGLENITLSEISQSKKLRTI